MEEINNTQLNNANLLPDEALLKSILKKSYVLYKKMLLMYDKHELIYEWRYYKDGGWLCKVQNKKKKTIVWMTACIGYIKATIHLQEKYIEGLFDLDIPEKYKEYFRNIKYTGKLMPCTFEVKSQKALDVMTAVVKYKLTLK